MQTGKPVAVISSTVADLPKHRWEVRDACLRQEFFPKMMEHLPASDANAITMSLALVEEAEVYVGIFAHRYGYVPEGYEVSITEMEYQHASKLHLERLIFLIGDNHAPLDGAEEQGSERALRLESLKNRLKETHVVNFFDSAEDLRGKLIHSLSRLRPREVTQVHRLSDIPMAPEPYIASPYTLLKPEGLVGRQHELEFLNNWMANTVDGLSGAAVLILSAMGGTGKSALAWTWFSDIAPDKIKPLPGKLWWSFYESDAQFENFLTRALAYASGHSEAALRQLPRPERERDLLALLNGKPFLLVLDGLERLLLAYSGRDAPFREGQLAGEEASLRACTDPRDGAFLRRLLSIRAARVLIGTRLIPAELQDETGASLPGIYVKELQGLTDNGAIELWRSLGVSGKPEKLISVFRTFGNHPLGIKVLAGEVGRYRKSPGDFERWRQDHDQVFDPFAVKGIQTMMRHTVAVALQGLGPDERQLLAMIAGFRMPASYDTLVALLVGGGRPFSRESDLDRGLAELEERGLVGWDRSANRYDLHPIIRGVA